MFRVPVLVLAAPTLSAARAFSVTVEPLPSMFIVPVGAADPLVPRPIDPFIVRSAPLLTLTVPLPPPATEETLNAANEPVALLAMVSVPLPPTPLPIAVAPVAISEEPAPVIVVVALVVLPTFSPLTLRSLPPLKVTGVFSVALFALKAIGWTAPTVRLPAVVVSAPLRANVRPTVLLSSETLLPPTFAAVIDGLMSSVTL